MSADTTHPFRLIPWLLELDSHSPYWLEWSSLKNVQTMLEKVWRIGNPLTLLVGMQNSAATMESSVEIP